MSNSKKMVIPDITGVVIDFTCPNSGCNNRINENWLYSELIEQSEMSILAVTCPKCETDFFLNFSTRLNLT